MTSRKIPQHVSSASASTPAAQSPNQGERANMELKQMMQALFDDFKTEIVDKMEKSIGKVENSIGKVEGELKEMRGMMEKNEERVQKAEEGIQENKTDIREVKSYVVELDKKQEKINLISDMDRAEYYLRFQNVIEEKEENLGETMVELIAEAIEEDKDKLRIDIDEIYRVNTRYAIKNKLPREVHIRFTKKSRKIEILQKLRNTTLKYKEKEITTLKQVPRRVRDLRRDYQFLTKKLIERGINFRWLIPEGILVMWHGQKIRLDTVDKAEFFYNEQYTYNQEEERAEKEREKREWRKQREEKGQDQLSTLLEGIALEKELEGATAMPARDQTEMRITRSSKITKQ